MQGFLSLDISVFQLWNTEAVADESDEQGLDDIWWQHATSSGHRHRPDAPSAAEEWAVATFFSGRFWAQSNWTPAL